MWAIALGLRRELRAPHIARVLLVLSIGASLSHVLLDYTNSYGVHPWWPIDNRWLYGDAVFIIEPWLWIVALPPLFFVARGLVPRILFALLLVAILGAAWRVGMVSREVAVVLTVGALLWALIARALPVSRRIVAGLSAFLALEAMFFLADAAGRRAVERKTGSSVRDVVLSPFPGHPFCLSALVVSADGGTYTVMGATVAPLPGWHSAAACGPSLRSVQEGDPADRTDSLGKQLERRGGRIARTGRRTLRGRGGAAIHARAELASHGNGDVALFDMRYGEGGFASIVARAGAPCTGPVPPWEWPRSDVLGAAP